MFRQISVETQLAIIKLDLAMAKYRLEALHEKGKISKEAIEGFRYLETARQQLKEAAGNLLYLDGEI